MAVIEKKVIDLREIFVMGGGTNPLSVSYETYLNIFLQTKIYISLIFFFFIFLGGEEGS